MRIQEVYNPEEGSHQNLYQASTLISDSQSPELSEINFSGTVVSLNFYFLFTWFFFCLPGLPISGTSLPNHGLLANTFLVKKKKKSITLACTGVSCNTDILALLQESGLVLDRAL